MKKMIGLALLAGAATTGVASAETTVSGNVALTSDYVFRGLSQTENAPAIQGGFDLTSGIFYAGTWASNVDFGPSATDVGMELDVYAGVKPVLGPVTMDFGVVGYFYPNANDEVALPAGSWDYMEVYGAASYAPIEGLSLGLGVNFSPELAGNGGDGWYYELNASYAVMDSLTISGAVGKQDADGDDPSYAAGYFTATSESDGAVDEYTTWNVGATYSIWGFGLDARYSDTDEEITNWSGTTVGGEKFIFTISRAL